MTPEEKALELQKKAEAAEAQALAAKEQAAAAEKKAADLKSELDAKGKELDEAKSNIDNLDKSIKSQDETIKELQKSIKAQPMGEKARVIAALNEQKEDIMAFLRTKDSGRKTFYLKVGGDVATSNITPQQGSQVWGSVMDPGIAAAPRMQNAFLMAFGIKQLPGARLVWRESSVTDKVGYVAELATNSNDASYAFTEKFRLPAKLATFMLISSEVEQWFPEIVNFVSVDAPRAILNKIDAEVYNGAGNDSTKPNEVYGVYGAATEHVKQTPVAVSNATIADLILDCAAQIRAAGFNANVAIIPSAWEQTLKGIKDTTGAYLYDGVNHMLAGINIIPSSKITTQMIVADDSVVDVFLGDTYELEFSRNAAQDAWRLDVRKLAQARVKSVLAAGVVKVASISTDIAALGTASEESADSNA